MELMSLIRNLRVARPPRNWLKPLKPLELRCPDQLVLEDDRESKE